MIIKNKKLDFDSCFEILDGFKNHDMHWCKDATNIYELKTNRFHSVWNTCSDETGSVKKIEGTLSLDNNFVKINLTKKDNGIDLDIKEYDKMLFNHISKIMKHLIPRLPTIFKDKQNGLKKLQTGKKHGFSIKNYKNNIFYLSKLTIVKTSASKLAYENAIQEGVISKRFAEFAQKREFKGIYKQ